MRQLTYDWSSKDKYAELRSSKMEETNMFKHYNISQVKRVPIIKNWLSMQGLHLFENTTQTEQELCNKKEGLFEMLRNNFAG